VGARGYLISAISVYLYNKIQRNERMGSFCSGVLLIH